MFGNETTLNSTFITPELKKTKTTNDASLSNLFTGLFAPKLNQSQTIKLEVSGSKMPPFLEKIKHLDII